MQGKRLFKFIKRGYTRPSHLTSIDIRHGRLTRDEALNIISKYEGKRPPSLDLFLNYLGIEETEFIEIALTDQVSPHVHDQSKIRPGKKLMILIHGQNLAVWKEVSQQNKYKRGKNEINKNTSSNESLK